MKPIGLPRIVHADGASSAAPRGNLPQKAKNFQAAGAAGDPIAQIGAKDVP
jgi:hypothetical protein